MASRFVRRLRRHRRGSVMLEFVLCVPILAFLLALVFFFGWAMMNQQHVKTATRYTAWRAVRGGAASDDQINRDFLAGRGDPVSHSVVAVSASTLDDYIDDAGAFGPHVRSLLDELIDSYWPHGTRGTVTAGFPGEVAFFNRFRGSIHWARARDGVEWRCGQARMEPAVVRTFLPGLDGALQGIAAPGGSMGQLCRDLYARGWSRHPDAHD